MHDCTSVFSSRFQTSLILPMICWRANLSGNNKLAIRSSFFHYSFPFSRNIILRADHFFFIYTIYSRISKIVLTTHMKLSWFDYLSRMENKKRLSHDRVFFFFFPSTIFTWANRISLRVLEDEFWCTVNGESEGERNLCNMKLG